MANIKIPSAFFQSPIWRKPRAYTEVDAYLDLHTISAPLSLRGLATRWGWHPQSVKRFLKVLKDAKCDTFVTPFVTGFGLKTNELQRNCDTICDTFVTPLRENPPLQETKERSKEKRLA